MSFAHAPLTDDYEEDMSFVLRPLTEYYEDEG